MTPIDRADARTPARWLAQKLSAWRAVAAHALAPEKAPVPAGWFTDAEDAAYDATFAGDDPRRIDDATWRDLDGRALLQRLAGDAGIHARQWLTHRLRRGATIECRGERPAWLGADADADRLLADTARARLQLRRQDTDLTGVLFRDEAVRLPAWMAHLRWAKGLWVVAALALLTGHVGLAAALFAGYLGVLGGVEIRFYNRAQAWKRQRRAVITMLRGAVELGAAAHRHPHPALAQMGERHDDARRLLAALDLDALETKATSAEYLNLFTLQEYAGAPARRAVLEESLPALRALYAAMAECEGRLCLVAWLRGPRRACWTRVADERTLHAVDLRNPLLDDALPVSIALHGQGALLTGENGVGKSTLLRAVGLNLLLARAFGFCHAAEAALPLQTVHSSIVHEDSTAVGDSLYMAEMRRAKALLDAAGRPGGAVFLVDEIFRGTNHLESVACAGAVLHRLAAAGPVLVSTHNAVLAPLMRARLAPLRVTRTREGALALEPGVLQEPNGIAMMARYAIDDAVRADARRVHDWFAGHVATPATFPALD